VQSTRICSPVYTRWLVACKLQEAVETEAVEKEAVEKEERER